MVTPDLARSGDSYIATYTVTITQPGHDNITKTAGPVAIPSEAEANSAYLTSSTVQAVTNQAVAQAAWQIDVANNWQGGDIPPRPPDHQYSFADFPPLNIPPPAEGAQAYADELPEWDVKMGVDVTPGSWHQDYSPKVPAKYERDANGVQQLVQPEIPPKPLGTWQCQGFDIKWDGKPPVLYKGTPAVADSVDIPGDPRQMADEIWRHWRAGTIATLPSENNTTYVGVPTCAWIENSGRPTHTVNLPSKSHVTGTSYRGPVTITEYINIEIAPEPVQWHFDDPDGKPSGFEEGRGAKPVTIPQYDPATQSWPNPQSVCPVFHQYSSVRDQVQISATQIYDFKITGYFNNGDGRTELAPIVYQRQAEWTGTPMHVYQIQGIPFVPAP
ncbi:MAG TPA: hypothetical protein VE219_06360 [Candidatus Sulfotelmatobacter sp.]|nr:hypothetical protein [Candidatus Sulfotelmatobacter sp.]